MKHIVFMTQAVVEKNMVEKSEYFSCIRKHLSSLKDLKDTKLTIKMHPAEKYINEYKKIIGSLKLNAAIIQKGRGEYFLETLLDSADVVIGFKSSTLNMTMMLGKPIITIGILDGKYDLNEYYFSDKEDRSVLKIAQNGDLFNAVKKVLYNRKFRAALLKREHDYIKNAYRYDGPVYKRIADMIVKVADSKLPIEQQNNNDANSKSQSDSYNKNVKSDKILIGKAPLLWFFAPSINRRMSPLSLENCISTTIYKKTFMINEKIKQMASRKVISFPNYDVLFLTFTNCVSGSKAKHFNNLMPAVVEKGLSCSLLVFDPLSSLSARKLHSLDNTVYGYIDYVDKSKIKSQANHIARQMSAIIEMTPEKEIYLSSEMIYIVLLYYEAIREAIKQHKTRILVLTGDLSILERCAIAAADSCNIRVVLAPVGLGFGITDYPDLRNIYMAAFGNSFKEMLVKKGAYKKNIMVTGSLLYEDSIKYMQNKTVQRK
ncbi:MAG: hypothetical protein HZB65_02940 [Candidatus Aenigmarchaeota archaeon]|nr:hypothetical protein [Candidatus Aenigmarchaeota archaeon]